ncbi:phosphate-regulating neutral endopeptidase PHEX [Ciona intestinalis]
MKPFSRLHGFILCFIFAALHNHCQALDVLSHEEHDVEVPDFSAEQNDIYEEMAQIPDSGLPRDEVEDEDLLSAIRRVQEQSEDGFLLRSEDEETGEVEDEEDQEEVRMSDLPFEDEEDDIYMHRADEEDYTHDISKRSFADELLEEMRRVMEDDLIGRHGAASTGSNVSPRKSCSAFRGPTTHSIKQCGSTKTFLGVVQWCKLSCGAGYKLVKSTPEYELCGKATKYRWTYQLKGLHQASEKCVLGANNFNASICMTPECVSTAAYYMNKIDFTVDPCNDFYDYSCGRWFKETKIPASKGHYLTYTVLRDRVNKDVAGELAKPIKASEGTAVAKVKTAYKACMDTATINRKGGKPLLNFLKGDLAWPIIDKTWSPSSFDLESTLATLRGRYNNQLLMKIIARRTSGNHILELWKGKMALPFSYYEMEEKKPKLDAYYALMRDTAVMLGADRATANRDVADVKRFEKELAFHKRHDLDYFSIKTIDQMMVEIPGIDWLRLFSLMIISHPINGNTHMEVWNQQFLHNVIALIDRTDKRVVQNYMVWRIVKHRILNLSHKFLVRYSQYKQILYGTKVLPTREHKCTQQLMFTMKGATGNLFINKYFSPAKKRAAHLMFDNIRKGFLQLLNTEVDWMDAKTKNYAKRKAEAINAVFGYNAHIYKNLTYIDEHMKHLVVHENDYFGNTVRILTQISQNSFHLLGKEYKRGTYYFHTRPTEVNAFYNPSYNEVAMPAGELQYPFYWGDQFPQMFQYGGVGTILGHELTHGFDNNGRKHGIHGHMYNWWTQKSLEEFNKRTKCMENQYNKFYWKTAGSYINGRKTLGENIADNGGIRESYTGYHIWLKSQNLTGESLEPSTGLTNDQLFFIGFANVRCGKYTHAGAANINAVDVHSPGRFRVIGSLQNFDKFSKAFNCPVGSKMNPKHKCIIW